MAVLVRPRSWGKTKPPPGSRINRGHPLAQGLSFYLPFNEQAGIPVPILSRGYTPAGVMSAVVWHPRGLLVPNDSLTDQLRYSGDVGYGLPTAFGTVVVSCRPAFSPTDGKEHGLLTFSGGGAFSTAPGIDMMKWSDGNWYVGWVASGDFRIATSASGTFVAEQECLMALTWDSANVVQRFTINAVQIGVRTSAFSTGATASTTQGVIRIGNGEFQHGVNNSEYSANGQIHWVGVWDRVLSDTELRGLMAEPYCFMAPPAPRGLYLPVNSSATVNQLAVSGAITPAGALSKQDLKVLAGGLTPVGSLAKGTAKSAGGGLTPTGSESNRAGKGLAGAVTPTGAATKSVAKAFAGGVTPAGSLARGIGKALVGTLTPTGGVAKAISKFVAGVISFVGQLSGLTAPDTNPLTLTHRARGHQTSLADTGHTATVRGRGHTVTAREQR